MKTHVLATLALGAAAMITSCNNSSTTEETTTTKSDSVAMSPAPRRDVTLAAVSQSPDFPGATLAIASTKAEKTATDSAKVTFNFSVKNYELKMQTADTATKMCNNSAKGQHIHFILDNMPYVALYEPKHEVTLAKNSEHYLMAFLSRSYHESIKSKGAALVYHFKVDENGNIKKLDDAKTPMVFYSRPKGDYFGKDTANVLFDYYVWNFEPAADGYKVKADITPAGGNATTVMMEKWEPKFLQGLGMGKNSITLSLVDKDGKQVQGPNTSVTREFNLMAQEGAK